MSLPDGEDELIVAENVTIERALVLAVRHGHAGRATILHREWCGFRIFEIGRRHPATMAFEAVFETLVKRTDDPMADADDAMGNLAEILLNDTRVFWSGRIETDEEHLAKEPDKGDDMTDDRLLDVYLPGFSGFSAPEWEAVCTENLIRVDGVMESPKLAE
jgi:hypothetical protein